MAATPPIFTRPAYLLYKAGLYAQKAFDGAFETVGLSAREFLVLAFATTEPLSQQEIARRLGIDPTVLVGVVDELERRGLVERRRDPDDRRRYHLAVTESGVELLAKAERTATEATQAFLEPLDGAQRRHLGELLITLMTPKMPWLEGDGR
jgi:MarR family transcriptional regulator, lower aerobic nicotinate degradation pathway regulator